MNFSESDGMAASIRVAYIASWAAVSVGTDGGVHRFGDCAEESIIPAALRRRLGGFGRMAVTCGLSVGGADTSDLLFCSRYGDVDLAYRLLSELVAGGTMSPAGFSLSVHNAVPGVMDLARKCGIGHTAIAGGSQSLSSGLTEAWGKLAENPQDNVVVVYAEVPLPEIFAERSENAERGHALAFTLSLAKPGKICGVLRLDPGLDQAGDRLDAPDSESLSGLLVDALNMQEPRGFRWRSRGMSWHFQGGADVAP